MNRRSFLIGSSAILAAPAIVRAASLVPVSVLRPSLIVGVDLASGPDFTSVVSIDLAGIPFARYGAWVGIGFNPAGGFARLPPQSGA